MRANSIKSDLRSLSGFLDKWGKNVKNAGLLSKINVSDSTDGTIKYSIEKSEPLIFRNIELERHSIPSGIENLPFDNNTFEVHLNMRLTERDGKDDLFDPIVSLGVSIKIAAEYFTENDIKSAMCSWHLDRADSSKSDYCHPIYHLNFGGDQMTALALQNESYFGNLLLLPNPRIIHPPLDLILACDFVINNFYKRDNHKKMTDLPGYKMLINRAAERYWKAYTFAFASKWNKDLNVSNLTHNHIIGIH